MGYSGAQRVRMSQAPDLRKLVSLSMQKILVYDRPSVCLHHRQTNVKFQTF